MGCDRQHLSSRPPRGLVGALDSGGRYHPTLDERNYGNVQATDETNEFANTCSKNSRSLQLRTGLDRRLADQRTKIRMCRKVSRRRHSKSQPMVPGGTCAEQLLRDLDEEQTTAPDDRTQTSRRMSLTEPRVPVKEKARTFHAPSRRERRQAIPALCERVLNAARTREKLRRDTLNSRINKAQRSARTWLCAKEK